ncbi:AtuA-related protein [Paraburkholderia fungorum]|uniref:AtuA-related protein n=1 Tax=Paraburkholderia fungorum TaxID=134537 RepID=UPI002097AF00|nr:hypothetical protein [Paraburkholderia fungorum]USX06818.1 hypothetical protein NHH62_18400 [Paraburkholderia fungorum]
MTRLLRDICYVRSGDKGDVCTAGLIARMPADYPLLLASATPERIRALFGDWLQGPVQCHRMDNIQALVVVLNNALGGGATRTLRLDQTGKALGHALLRLPVCAMAESMAAGGGEDEVASPAVPGARWSVDG